MNLTDDILTQLTNVSTIEELTETSSLIISCGPETNEEALLMLFMCLPNYPHIKSLQVIVHLNALAESNPFSLFLLLATQLYDPLNNFWSHLWHFKLSAHVHFDEDDLFEDDLLQCMELLSKSSQNFSHLKSCVFSVHSYHSQLSYIFCHHIVNFLAKLPVKNLIQLEVTLLGVNVENDDEDDNDPDITNTKIIDFLKSCSNLQKFKCDIPKLNFSVATSLSQFLLKNVRLTEAELKSNNIHISLKNKKATINFNMDEETSPEVEILNSYFLILSKSIQNNHSLCALCFNTTSHFAQEVIKQAFWDISQNKTLTSLGFNLGNSIYLDYLGCFNSNFHLTTIHINHLANLPLQFVRFIMERNRKNLNEILKIGFESENNPLSLEKIQNWNVNKRIVCDKILFYYLINLIHKLPIESVLYLRFLNSLIFSLGDSNYRRLPAELKANIASYLDNNELNTLAQTTGGFFFRKGKETLSNSLDTGKRGRSSDEFEKEIKRVKRNSITPL